MALESINLAASMIIIGQKVSLMAFTVSQIDVEL